MAGDVSIDLELHFDKVSPAAEAAVVRALGGWAELVMSESNAEAPKDTGYMLSTSYIDQPEVISGQISMGMGYRADYAIYPHERLELHHPVGKAKFLEDPMNRNAPKLLAEVSKEIQADIGKL